MTGQWSEEKLRKEKSFSSPKVINISEKYTTVFLGWNTEIHYLYQQKQNFNQATLH